MVNGTSTNMKLVKEVGYVILVILLVVWIGWKKLVMKTNKRIRQNITIGGLRIRQKSTIGGSNPKKTQAIFP